MESNGKIIPSKNSGKSHYLIMEDGYISTMWDGLNGNAVLDNLNRKFVHSRWIKDCIKHNIVHEDFDRLHYIPLPCAVPIKEFSEATLIFTKCNGREKDEYVFKKLGQLYGFNFM
jgi:hypothetical protein